MFQKKDFKMPRKTRIYLPNVPVHIVQRGQNREEHIKLIDGNRNLSEIPSSQKRILPKSLSEYEKYPITVMQPCTPPIKVVDTA